MLPTSRHFLALLNPARHFLALIQYMYPSAPRHFCYGRARTATGPCRAPRTLLRHDNIETLNAGVRLTPPDLTCSVSEVNYIDQLMARSTNAPLIRGQNCRYAWSSTFNTPLTSSRDSSDARLCRASGGRRGIRDYCCDVSDLSHAHWKSWAWCDNLGLTPCAGLKRGNGNCPSGKIEVALQNNEYRCKHGTADRSLSLRQGQWKKGEGCAQRLGRTKRVLTRVRTPCLVCLLPPLNLGTRDGNDGQA